MMDWIFNGEYSAETFVAAVIILILTDQLVIGRRLRRAETERDQWRDMTLRLLGITTKVVDEGTAIRAAEVERSDQAKKNEG